MYPACPLAQSVCGACVDAYIILRQHESLSLSLLLRIVGSIIYGCVCCSVDLVLQAGRTGSKRRRDQDTFAGPDAADVVGGESMRRRVAKKARKVATRSKTGNDSQRHGAGGKPPSPCGFVDVAPYIGSGVSFLAICCERISNPNVAYCLRVGDVFAVFSQSITFRFAVKPDHRRTCACLTGLEYDREQNSRHFKVRVRAYGGWFSLCSHRMFYYLLSLVMESTTGWTCVTHRDCKVVVSMSVAGSTRICLCYLLSTRTSASGCAALEFFSSIIT